MEILAPDTLRSIALYLDPEDLLYFCAISRRFALICNDSYFWRNKLYIDFPNINTNHIKLSDFKIEYLKRYEQSLQLEASVIRHSYRDDPEYKMRQQEIPKLEKQIEEIDKEHSLMSSNPIAEGYKKIIRINRVRSEIDSIIESQDIEQKYLMKAIKIKNKARKLRENNIDLWYDNHYYSIRLPAQNFFDIDEQNIWNKYSRSGEARVFERYLIDQDVIDDIILKEGTLIGLSFDTITKNKTPTFLIYVYGSPSDLYIEVYHKLEDFAGEWSQLSKMMRDRHATADNLRKIYNLPFNMPKQLKVSSYFEPSEILPPLQSIDIKEHNDEVPELIYNE